MLEASGWQATHIKASSQPFTWLKILAHAASADAVVVIRKTFSKPLLKTLRLVSKRLIYDFDDAWTRGKCALKVIQCMAAGLPVISSPVGVNKDMVLPDVTGFLVKNAAEWLSAIQQLQSDEQLRMKMGAAGRQRVIEHYSITATFAKMRAVLENY